MEVGRVVESKEKGGRKEGEGVKGKEGERMRDS